MSIETKISKAALKGLVDLIEKQLDKPARPLGEWRGECIFEPTDNPDIEIFHQSPADPHRLVVYDENGEPWIEYAILGKHPTDFGSIPKWAQKLSAKTGLLNLKPRDFKFAYSFHDGVYLYGGVWARLFGDAAWTFIPLIRVEGDVLLYIALTADAATIARAQTVYRSVRLGAGQAWENHRANDTKENA